MKSVALMMLVWMVLATSAAAQSEAQVNLRARVLTVAETMAEIDRGSMDGVEPGDWVKLQPLTGGEISVQVERVEEHSCWVRLQASGLVEAGVACEIKVTLSAAESGQGAGNGMGENLPTAAPQWSKPINPWDPLRPLLADDPLTPEERDPIWSGRFYSSFHTNMENENQNSTSTFARTGFDLRGENPFGIGGRIRLSVDLDHRSYSDDDGDDSQFHGRIERLSYAHGGDRFQPLRWEVGRFVSDLFPEFGVVDGVEMRYRLASGMQIGGSLGYIPEPSADYETGNDLQVAAYMQAVQGEQRTLRWGAGVQKTWHDGTADRDLMLFKLDYVPDSNFRLYSSAWVDFYDADDTGKSEGAELTTAQARAYWRQKDYGASLGYRQWRYPQVLRYQAGSFTNTELLEENTSRADLRVWSKWDANMRISGRLDSWQSDDKDGGGAELRLDWYDLIGPDLDTSFLLYSRQGSYTDATGFRLDQYIGLENGSLRVSWETANYAPSDGGDSELTEHDVRLSWDYWSAGGWSFNLDGGIRFGDQVNNPYLGLYLQRRF
jgi:hypothetical protein